MLEKLKKIIPTESKVGFWLPGEYGDFEIEFIVKEDFTDDDIIFIQQFILFCKRFERVVPLGGELCKFKDNLLKILVEDYKKYIIFEIINKMHFNDCLFNNIEYQSMKIFYHEANVGIHQIDKDASDLSKFVTDEYAAEIEKLLAEMKDVYITYYLE